MAVLTAKQIADILSAATFTEDVSVNPALLQNEERRKYPSIDVQNVTGQDQIKNFPTTTSSQTFLVHLFYRYRSFGEVHEEDIKKIEDTIFDTLDDDTNFSTDLKVSITQGWRRTSETFPLHRSHSILTVSTEEISGTDPATDATPGDQIEFLITNFGQFKVISIPSDEIGILKELNLQDTATQTYTRIRTLGLLSVELALSPAQEDSLFALIDAGNNEIVELILNLVSRSLRVNFTNMIASSTREEIRTTILTMDVIEWI